MVQLSTLNNIESISGLHEQYLIRPLGGYERLLSRKCPDSNAVALSHVAGYLINSMIDSQLLHSAMVYAVKR